MGHDVAGLTDGVWRRDARFCFTQPLKPQVATLWVISHHFFVFAVGFLPGAFRINVGLIALAEDPGGFIDIVLIPVLITILKVVLVRWRR